MSNITDFAAESPIDKISTQNLMYNCPL